MSKRILLFVVAACCLFTAAVYAAPRVLPPGAIALHVAGGIAGLDDWVIVKADGTVIAASRTSERVVRKLSKSERTALVNAFQSAGFFSWNPIYGGPTAADGQNRTLSFDDGTRKKSVTWTDPGTPPAGFAPLMKRMQALGQ